MSEIELIEKAALKVGIKSLLNMGGGSCVYSEGCNGVTQDHLVALVREVALHCAVALGDSRPALSTQPAAPSPAVADGYKERCPHSVRWENRCDSCAAPPAPASRVPLSDERVREIWLAGKDHGDDWLDVLGITRDVEAAHGIHPASEGGEG